MNYSAFESFHDVHISDNSDKSSLVSTWNRAADQAKIDDRGSGFTLGVRCSAVKRQRRTTVPA